MPLLIIALSLIILYFAFGLVIFLSAFHRKKDLKWQSAKALANTPWGPFAEQIPNNFKWIEENGAVDITIPSFDGTVLKGKWIKTENAKASIIVVHGYKGHYAGDYGMVLPEYKAQGYNVLTFRHRAHGESGGKYITFGAKEHKDLLAVIDFHNKNYGEIPLFISGISMGASTVLYASNQDLPKNVKALSADCGFTSPYEIVSKVVSDTLHFNAKFLTWGANLWCKLLAGFDMKKYNTEEVLKTAKRPILFIHGEADDFVPCEMTIRGYNACTSEKELLIVEGAGHGMSYVVDKERVTKTFVNFFKKHLND